MAGREDDTASRVAQEKMIEQFGRFIEVAILLLGLFCPKSRLLKIYLSEISTI